MKEVLINGTNWGDDMGKIKLILGASVFALLLAFPQVQAETIRFDFRGYITISELVEGPDIGLPIPGAPEFNTPISGYYTFESSSIDSYAGEVYGQYDNLISLAVKIGTLEYTFSDSNPNAQGIIQVDNNAGTLYVRDRYGVRVSGNSSFDIFTGPNIGDFKLYNFSLALFDWGGNVDPDLVTDDSLPLTPPDMALLTDAFNFGNNATTDIIFSFIDGQTRGQLRGEVTSLTTSPKSVNIDIKPGNKKNKIKPRSKGKIWVAILSDTNNESPFNPLEIDIDSIRFGPDEAKAKRHKVKDVNRDGLPDLLLRFKIRKTGIACGDSEATLTGNFPSGVSITGTDSIKTVRCKRK